MANICATKKPAVMSRGCTGNKLRDHDGIPRKPLKEVDDDPMEFLVAHAKTNAREAIAKSKELTIRMSASFLAKNKTMQIAAPPPRVNPSKTFNLEFVEEDIS